MKISNEKIGVILTSYGADPALLKKCLAPWVDAQKDLNILISSVHCSFDKYDNSIPPTQEEIDLLTSNSNFFFSNEGKKVEEREARNAALKPLLENECDYIILLDHDEIWTKNSILDSIEYVKKYEKYFPSFKVGMKNFVFDENTFLEDPVYFYRIYVVNYKINNTTESGMRLLGFYWDNEVLYENKKDPRFKIQNVSLSCGTIPTNIANPNHYSWLNNERSRKKVEYQTDRWGKKSCSYIWDYEESKLEFSPHYYKGKQIPKVKCIE